MSIDIAKRALLRGRLRPPVVLTPPWALEFDAFTDACTRCGECIEKCPQQILIRGDGGFPTVMFANGECTFCRACVTACPTGALSAATALPWTQIARVAETCLTHRGIHCQSCRDSCPVSAIAFKPTLGRVPPPNIDGTRCTGCGACVSVCPADAIAVSPLEASP